ncbi:hypothetical protein HKBW3S06_00479 [Candidatus Hakubella thermalkaliphila]|uniref:Uncharacterized protein n=1 Tax=Candidatus Hakubella thermalkaliphila TaxID=2754717 RepID=A0A6V8NMB9_9ACTN|nr:hypothetical protein HKBW3S06_00479 [Candidatus Hakubella thermalkaliphila]
MQRFKIHEIDPVSIHALARRATAMAIFAQSDQISFNPRPRTEGDMSEMEIASDLQLFQSTPSHGGRQEYRGSPVVVFRFQSTPSHGGRHG